MNRPNLKIVKSRPVPSQSEISELRTAMLDVLCHTETILAHVEKYDTSNLLDLLSPGEAERFKLVLDRLLRYQMRHETRDYAEFMRL